MTGQLVDSFLDCFSRHVHILDATVAVKQDFADIVDSQDNLRLIQLPSWAGLGAVQYVYAFFVITFHQLEIAAAFIAFQILRTVTSTRP